MFESEIDTSGTVLNLRIPDVIKAVTKVTQNPGKATGGGVFGSGGKLFQSNHAMANFTPFYGRLASH